MKLPLKERLKNIVLESDTAPGRLYDLALIGCIVASIIVVILESVSSIHASIGVELYYAEWFFTVLFTIDYILRLATVRRPLSYIFSFFGIVDLLATLPTYLSVVIPGAQSLLIIRVFRLLRVFRIFRLSQFLGEANFLLLALKASGPKIIVFLMVVASTVLTAGAVMYVIEGPVHGFTSIPKGIYWAIVTMTTVGFGDITPQTSFGQFFASCLMILGYGVIAVPTGIVTTELARAVNMASLAHRVCPTCKMESHLADAKFCRLCATQLP